MISWDHPCVCHRPFFLPGYWRDHSRFVTNTEFNRPESVIAETQHGAVIVNIGLATDFGNSSGLNGGVRGTFNIGEACEP